MNMFIALWRLVFAPTEPVWLSDPSDDPLHWGGLAAEDRRQVQLARLAPDPRLSQAEGAPLTGPAAAKFEINAVAPTPSPAGLALPSRSWGDPGDGPINEEPEGIRGRSRTPPAPWEGARW